MFGLGPNGERVHSCTQSCVSHMAEINNQRMEGGMIATLATLALSLVGLWVITQLRIWRYVRHARQCAPPALRQGGLRA